MSKSIVSITKTSKKPDQKNIYQAVEKALNLIGGIKEVIKKGGKVLIMHQIFLLQFRGVHLALV